MRKRSAVWLSFNEYPTEEKAECKHCHASISFKGGNICNLTRHLKAKHRSIFLQLLCTGYISKAKKRASKVIQKPKDHSEVNTNTSHTTMEITEVRAFEEGVNIKTEDLDITDILIDPEPNYQSESIPSLPAIVELKDSAISLTALCSTKEPLPPPPSPPVVVNRPGTPPALTIVPSSAPSRLLRSSTGRVGKRSLVRIAELEKQIKHLQKSLNQSDEDEFDLFGRSIALQLKRMPLERAFVCQESLQRVMMQERLRSMTNGH